MKLSKDKVVKIKKLLKKNSIIGTSKLVGVSYGVVRNVSRGVYDTDQDKCEFVQSNVCPITGFSLLRLG